MDKMEIMQKKRRTNTNGKTNNDVTPSKLRKKEPSLEQLTKQKVIDKYRKLEEDYLKLLTVNKKSDYENKVLKCRVAELETKFDAYTKSSPVETQTVNETDDLKFNCTDCIHETNSEKALRWHVFHVHNKGNPEILMNFSCNKCHQKFHQQFELMNHIKREHTESVAICKYFKDGQCNYSAAKCWFKHPHENSQHEKAYECNYCEEKCDSKSEIMKHRKSNHNLVVPICRNFKNNSCKFGNDCWYNHKQGIQSSI